MGYASHGKKLVRKKENGERIPEREVAKYRRRVLEFVKFNVKNEKGPHSKGARRERHGDYVRVMHARRALRNLTHLDRNIPGFKGFPKYK